VKEDRLPIVVYARIDITAIATLWRFYAESGAPALTMGTLLRRVVEDFGSIIIQKELVKPVETVYEATAIVTNAFHNTRTNPALLKILAESELLEEAEGKVITPDAN